MFQLSNPERQLLLEIARGAVRAHLAKEKPPVREIPDGALRQLHGVFVSIHRDAELRGCIGRVQSDRPLYETTAECAVSAAVADPRFLPMEVEELDHVSFEISALTPLTTIEGVDQLEVGRHGLMVEKGPSRGLLLPQVASRYGWERREFLRQTCLKAGLGPDEWQSGANIFVFEAIVFEEPSNLSAHP